MHNDICLTGSLTAFLEVRPRAEPSGTVSRRCRHRRNSQTLVFQLSTVDATRHDRHMVVISHCPSASSWIQKLALEHIIRWAREERHTKKFVKRWRTRLVMSDSCDKEREDRRSRQSEWAAVTEDHHSCRQESRFRAVELLGRIDLAAIESSRVNHRCL